MMDFSDANPRPPNGFDFEDRPYFDKEEIEAKLQQNAVWVLDCFPHAVMQHDKRAVRIGDLYGSKAMGDGSAIIHLEGEFAGWGYDFNTGEKAGPLTLLERSSGISDFPKLLEYAASVAGALPIIKQKPSPQKDNSHKNKRAQEAKWSSLPWQGTPVQVYLKEVRKIPVEPGEDIKYCAQLFDGGTKQNYPGMVAIVRDKHGNEEPGIHRTFLLSPDGRGKAKPGKKMLGNINKGSVRLLPIDPDDLVLGIAEGIETALAAARIFFVPTWAALSAGNLADWEWPDGIKKLVIFADANKPHKKGLQGEDAAKKLFERAVKANLPCELYTPLHGDDFNDDLVKGCKREDYFVPDTAVPLEEATALTAPVARSSKKAEKDEQKVQRLLSRPPWLRDAIKGSDGLTILGCVANVNMVLRGDPAFEGRITFDAFSKRVFRWNVPWDLEREAKEWSDIDDTRLAEYCQLQEVPAGTGVCAQAVASVAHEYPSHPPRDYLNGLKWDGIERLKDGPQVYFGAKRNVFASECFSRWMISAVARIMKPGCKADYTLVLEGLQRSGKSSSLEKLLPEKEWFSDDISGRIGDKDTALSLQGKMIVELGELSAFKGASASEIKAWLSRQVDRVRAPYGRRAMDVQRSNVFAATTNEAEYLKDPTGGSRFWPIKCGAFNLEAIERDRDQLWAEAVHLYKAGAKWWLPPEMEALARVEQESRRATDPWQALVLEWVETRTTGDITVERILSEECLDIRKDMQSPKAKSRVVDILTNNGWRQTRPRDDEGKRRRIYVKSDGTENDGTGTQG